MLLTCIGSLMGDLNLGKRVCPMSLARLARLAVCLSFFCAAVLAGAETQNSTSHTQKAASVKKPRKRVRRKRRRRHTVVAHRSQRRVVATTTRAAVIHTVRHRRRRHRIFRSPWDTPTYADSTLGDNPDGEDLEVRRAAVAALGRHNGAVVVADPETGRILSIVNQKLALQGAYEPCSTVKLVVSLASLSEGIVNPVARVRLSRRFSTNMTYALAYSVNAYFARLGEILGFDRVEKYAKLFGLGQRAGLDILGESPGYLADEPPASGVGMMTSFGDGIRLTPLQLASIVSTIANGGTLYYLQYPRSQEEVDKFVPRIKRELDIANFIPEIKPGLMGAVEYGTARRAVYNPSAPIFGKTGTCTDTTNPGVHLGWFGSFTAVGDKKLVVVVLLTGGFGVSGPIASGIGGAVYHNLAAEHYFGPQRNTLPTTLISMRDASSQ
ncbi:MAG: penicillin-binding transpeptidase domain-containing protein [Bryobacteraceae bacterium]